MKDSEELTLLDYKLVIFRDNWADEMNVQGWRIFSIDEWKAFQSKVPNEGFTWCVGTNEEIEYSSKEDFLKTFTVKSISKEQKEMLIKLFGRGVEFGHFPFEVIVERDEE